MNKEESYENVMNTYVEKEISAVYESNKSKPQQQYCIYGLGKLRTKSPIKLLLITCNQTPETIYSRAWYVAMRERDLIVKDLMRKYDNIHFAVTTIEHQHTISEKMKNVKEDDGECTKGKKNKKDEGTGEDTKDMDVKTKSMYNLYMSEKYEDFMDCLKNEKMEVNILKDMTSRDKAVTYYNAMNTLHYLNGESKRNANFKDWIVRTQNEMSLLIDEDNDMRINLLKWEVWQNILISKHKEMGNNLLGYPHIHIAIAYADIPNPEIFRREIFEYLMEKNIFPDPDVAAVKEKKSEIEGRSIMYVIKNHSNKYIYACLRKFDSEENIIRWYINSNSNKDDYVEFAKGFMVKGDKKYFKVIPADLIVVNRKPKPGLRLKILNQPLNVDPEKNNYNRTLSHIQETMEKNGTVICDGVIFKKRENAKMTYEKYTTIEEYVNEITSAEPYNVISIKWKGELVKLMKVSDVAYEKCSKLNMGSAEGNYRVKFARIKIDYRMIEFKDFYFNTITAEIYKDQNKYYCHYYSPVSLVNLENKIEKFRKDSVWLDILRRNGKDSEEVLSLFFSLLRPRAAKALLPMLYGESNAGKTELVKPFMSYYPDNKVSTFLSTMSEYHIEDLLVEKELSVMEEGNAILNYEEKGRARLLALLEGATVVANKKHGAIKNYKNRTNMIIATNVLSTDKYQDDDALMNRLYPIGNMKKLEKIVEVSNRIKKEEPYIYMLTGLAFMRLGKETEEEKETVNFFVIHEVMTEEHEEEIESIKRYYSGEGNDEEDKVDLYSDEYIEEQKMVEMKSRDNNRRTIYNRNHKLEVNKLRNHSVHSGINVLEIMDNEKKIKFIKEASNNMNNLANIYYGGYQKIEDVTNKI